MFVIDVSASKTATTSVSQGDGQTRLFALSQYYLLRIPGTDRDAYSYVKVSSNYCPADPAKRDKYRFPAYDLLFWFLF